MSELEQASRLKNCSSFSQNCTTSDLFIYHCLPNHYLNKFVEVCGVAVDIIYGHCAEYNEGGGVIQENYQTDCTKFSKPCPIESYSSVDTYKYVDCFNITPTKIPDTTENNERKEHGSKNITESPTSNDSSPDSEHVLRRQIAPWVCTKWKLNLKANMYMYTSCVPPFDDLDKPASYLKKRRKNYDKLFLKYLTKGGSTISLNFSISLYQRNVKHF
ncbi:uncharacterized protein LOC133203844 isoform X2 [Saccostrea echinata]|uniref:uncharacterized protein LOC133203844 isoform X2 n=1 Tax=Saccostrea echinata TaxID=191078 RepID=UPI002A839C3A|nr:uncharacterized protein LOC133203844 isoform X2 [Saccostrea echinata]